MPPLSELITLDSGDYFTGQKTPRRLGLGAGVLLYRHPFPPLFAPKAAIWDKDGEVILPVLDSGATHTSS